GAGVAGVTLLGAGTRRFVRRSRLKKRAETELIARAELNQLRVDRDLQDVMRAFDLSYKRGREIFEAGDRGGETLAVEAAVDLERVREHLYEVAQTKAGLIADLRALRRGSRVEALASAGDDLKKRAADRQREAERIATDTQQLAQRLVEVSSLLPG